MTIIGAAWLKQREEDKSMYYSISVDKAVLPLTITEDKGLILKENKNKFTSGNDKAPDFYLEMYSRVKPEDKKE